MTSQPAYVPEIDTTAAPMPVTVQKGTGFGSVQVASGIGLLTCVTWREVTGSAAGAARLHDGIDTTGQILATFGGAASASGDVSPGGPGIAFRAGLYLEAVSGNLEVTATFLPQVTPF